MQNRKQRDMRRGQGGFTLLELVVVLGIMTLLVGITLPNVVSLAQAEKRDATKDEMVSIRRAIEAYAHDVSALPPDLKALVKSNKKGWGGPYIGDHFTGDVAANEGYKSDAWRNPYEYKVLSKTKARLRSRGENGKKNGGKQDDITSEIDISSELRLLTRNRMDIINNAILRYNATYLPDTPLPEKSNGVINKLQSTGLLPSGNEWKKDAFGDKWVPSSPPVSSVSSKNFGG